MHVLFATRRAHLPDRGGGAQQSVHSLLRLLQAGGHGCEAVAALPPGPRLTAYRIARRLSGRRPIGWRDDRNGYATWRAAEGVVWSLAESRLKAARPDIVLADFFPPNDVSAAAARHGVPTLLRMVDVTFANEGHPVPDDPWILPYSNSAFVAARVEAVSGRPSPVIHPIVHAERYRVARENARFITLVNPIAMKGVETALAIARLLPHRQFVFVEAWPLSNACRTRLAARLEELPNVTLMPWTSDVRSVYARTFVLIVPSVIEEAFGRVALEAQASGIPVVAHAVGGLPESVGAGGVLIPREDPPDRWADVLERLFVDAALYRRLSLAAEVNLRRPEFMPGAIVDRFVELARSQLATTRRLTRRSVVRGNSCQERSC